MKSRSIKIISLILITAVVTMACSLSNITGEITGANARHATETAVVAATEEARATDTAIAEATAEANATNTAIAEANATNTAIAEANATNTAIAEANATNTAIAEANATNTAIAEANATNTAIAEAIGAAQAKNSIIGSWTLYFDWDCTGNSSNTSWVFSENQLISGNQYTATWEVVGNRITIVYQTDNQTTYIGTVDNGYMEGTMSNNKGMSGCWTATKNN